MLDEKQLYPAEMVGLRPRWGKIYGAIVVVIILIVGAVFGLYQIFGQSQPANANVKVCILPDEKPCYYAEKFGVSQINSCMLLDDKVFLCNTPYVMVDLKK